MVQQTEKMSNLLAYFEWAIDQIVIDADFAEKSRGTIAFVPSSHDDCDPYIVTVDESAKAPHAIDCTCNDRYYHKKRNPEHECKHMQVTNLYFQRIAALFAHDEQEEVAEPAGIEVNALMLKNRELYRAGKWNEDGELTPVSEVMPNEYDILGPTKHVHCGGCHQICGEGKGDRCKPGFCFWNSFWTEAQRAA